MRRSVVILIGLAFALCCVVAALGGLAYFFVLPAAAAEPGVVINTPSYGEEVEVGERVTVQATARDDTGVVRIELWVGDELQATQRSSLPGGTSPFPLLAYWRPPSAGTHTLVVRAINTQGVQGQASVNVEAVELGDRDGDGVPDEEDRCPDEPGSDLAHGCPDRDRDGIPDAEDACPDEAGLPEADGCPAPSEEDRDGDGLLDWADACPDEPGPPLTEGCPDRDGDGVADADDACPDEPGSPRHDGCPTPGDLDGDGVPDEEDDCPVDFGVPEHSGCPDSDGDGLRDMDDRCPFEPGPPELDGCPDRDSDGVADPDDVRPDEPGDTDHGAPDTGAPDSDGDGFPDPDDPCPEDFGEEDGCPPPEPPETDEGDVFGDMGSWATVWTVEFQALEFEVFDDYDEVYCYASLADEDEDRYGPFEIGDEARHWNISAELGSRFVAFEAESLRVHAECWAANIELGPEGGWGVVWDLGSFTREHPRSDWLGQVITVESDPGPDGHYFEVQYRICEDSCEEAAFPPPFIHTVYYTPGGGPRRMAFSWDGDRSMITGFNLYVNDSLVRSVGRHLNSPIVPVEPSCGERLEYEVTAFSGDDPRSPDRESPRSNTYVLEGEPCPLTLRVTFHTLHTYDLPGDYESDDVPGPIYGDFMVEASSGTEWLSFDAAYCYHGPFSCFPVPVPCEGGGLERWNDYSISGIFGWIRTEIASCLGNGCISNSYRAPDTDSVVVELDRDEDLTIWGWIWDADACLMDDDNYLEDTVEIDGEEIIARQDEFARGVEYTLHGFQCSVDVDVRLIGGGP